MQKWKKMMKKKKKKKKKKRDTALACDVCVECESKSETDVRTKSLNNPLFIHLW